jgi:nitrite reductase/ring-hydroxylating ferredoxin subunit
VVYEAIVDAEVPPHISFDQAKSMTRALYRGGRRRRRSFATPSPSWSRSTCRTVEKRRKGNVRKLGGRRKTMGEFNAVFEESEVQEGAMRAVEVEGITLLVSRSESGEVCAIANTCTHRGGPLNEGDRDGNVVTCPWHGSQFDLCSGEVLRGPAREPQQRFETRVREGKIEVRSL